MNKIDKLIINSPYEEPQQFWEYFRDTREFKLQRGRRPAGYVVASESSKSFDDPGTFIEIDLVNTIRLRIKKWREDGYPGVTGITKRLLQHWQDPEERKDRRFFFCQLEAIETLIWLTEAPEADKTGIEIPGDGGEFSRWCNKMATGSGKTIVMAQLIAWNVLNKIANGKDTRFSKNVLIVAPGLTVRNRLSVLNPTDPENYYEEFNIVPAGLMDSLRQGKIKIINWHGLAWQTEEKIAKKKSVDKRGAKSDEAYVREVLGDMANASNIIVINDEAHHAWRIPAESKIKGVKKEDIEESTVWVGGLDRIHRARGILRCFDLSATPFAPSGKKASEEALFPWIVSDFGLNDAIEAGLVKTPRVVVRDDGNVDKDLRSRLYHIYMDETVKDDINQKVDESVPLPDLIKNAYLLLGKDWKATKDDWEKAGYKIPPVMITVANTTFTSGRIKYSFDKDAFNLSVAGLGDLCNPERTLQIDSKILQSAEAETEEVEIAEVEETEDDTEDAPKEKKLTKKQQAELLRRTVDTVGKIGEPGEQIQNVISVGMLSEGWDAKTVTHIMGLRAFSSQLLCEQVVGRGLRRTSYDVGEDGLFEPEYVNIFGVPFTFLPHEGGQDGPPPPPPKPKTEIKPVKEKAEHEISFPNVVRIDHIYKPQLTLNLGKVKSLELDPYDSITEAELAAIIAGKPNPAALSEIDLKEIAEKFRLQSIIFRIASTIYNSEKKPDWKGSKETFLIQLISIIEKFIYSNKIVIKNPLFNQDESRKRILIMLNMNKVVQHIWNEIRAVNTEALTPVFDKENPIRSSGDIRTWWTSKPNEAFDKTHINFVVVDSKWEYLEAKTINESNVVESFVKNDHLNFVIYYNYQGVVRRFFPDFLIKLTTGENLIVETKGQDNEQNKTKRAYLDEWCRAINQHGGFGKWSWAVSFDPNDLDQILQNSALRFSGHIFADTDDYNVAEKIFDATINFFETAGFEISEEGRIKQGSWFKEKVVYKIRNVFRSKEAKEIFDKTKKAIELQQIEVHQSQANKNNAEAAAVLLTAVKDVPFFATKMGSLVIIKTTDQNGKEQVITRLLTTEETIFYDRNPALLNNPIELLNSLNNGDDKKRLN
ncbi:MAG: DEAD/DEAH box helicase family protein [Ignavibacteriaceae bacterium]|jgi:type III restriction enzyme|nr:DEAD/DEAH box helicase family protein [Ignavibacteriaceae bacterium]